MSVSRARWRILFLTALTSAPLLTGCSERLEGGAACPALCPESGLRIIDTSLAAVTLDASLRSYPPPGGETEMRLTQRFDATDTALIAGVVRFDSVPSRIVRATSDTVPIIALDSARIVAYFPTTFDTLVKVDLAKREPVTFEFYDVDTTDSGFDGQAVAPLFRDDRRLGQTTIRSDSIKDSIRVALDAARLLPKVSAGGRVRIGMRIRSPVSMQIPVQTVEAGGGARLRLYPRNGEDTDTVEVQPNSRIVDVFTLDLRDYMVVLRGSPRVADPILQLGGLPGARLYFRFALPPRFADSLTIVRAALVLTQIPNRYFDETDSTGIIPSVVLAQGEQANDLQRAALVLSRLGTMPGTRRRPGDAGALRIEMVGALQFWRATRELDPDLPRALVLQTSGEGVIPAEFYFYSSEAADPLVRPRLEISYIPRTEFGLP